MPIRPILQWPDPRLSQTCAPVDAVTEETLSLIKDLFHTMYAAPGRGLAAPQIGVMQRVFVIDTGWKEGADDPIAFINPEILGASDTTATQDEGCLSIPGVLAPVTRPGRVHVRWLAEDGTPQTRWFEGFAAACIQHELDHLNGTVTFDRLDPAMRTTLEATYLASA